MLANTYFQNYPQIDVVHKTTKISTLRNETAEEIDEHQVSKELKKV